MNKPELSLSESVQVLRTARAKIKRMIDREEIFYEEDCDAAIALVQLCGKMLEDVNEDGEWADQVCELVSGTDAGKKFVEEFVTNRNNGNIRRQKEAYPTITPLNWVFDGNPDRGVSTADSSCGRYRIVHWSENEFFASHNTQNIVQCDNFDEAKDHCQMHFNIAEKTKKGPEF